MMHRAMQLQECGCNLAAVDSSGVTSVTNLTSISNGVRIRFCCMSRGFEGPQHLHKTIVTTSHYCLANFFPRFCKAWLAHACVSEETVMICQLKTGRVPIELLDRIIVMNKSHMRSCIMCDVVQTRYSGTKNSCHCGKAESGPTLVKPDRQTSRGLECS